MTIIQLRSLIRRYGDCGCFLVGAYLMARWVWKCKRLCTLLPCACVILALFVFGTRNVTFMLQEEKENTTWSVLDLGTLTGDSASGANAVNERGEVVGWSGEKGKITRAFYRQGGKMTGLPSGHRRSSEATAINSSGEVCGWFGAEAYTSSRPCLWQSGKVRDLGVVAGCTFGRANSINDKGQIVGVSYNSNGSARGEQLACLWQNGKPVCLNLSLDEEESEAVGINNKGQVAGRFNWMRDYKAFYHDGRSNQAEELPNLKGLWWGANAVNDAGQVVGQADIGPETTPGYGYVSHACLWQGGKANDLGTLGGGKSMAMSINRSGQIVGWSFINDNPKYELRAFLWQKGKMSDLNATLPTNSGWILEQANGINDKGQIVGTGLHDGRRRAFLLTPRR